MEGGREGGREGAQHGGRQAGRQLTEGRQRGRARTIGSIGSACHGHTQGGRETRDTAAGSNGVLWCAPSQACNTKTARSISPEQVNQVGTSWGKALAHPGWEFHG